MKKAIILVFILVIVLLIIYQQNDYIDKQTVISKKVSITDNPIDNKEKPKKANKRLNNKVPLVDNYQQLTLQEKETLFSRCIGYANSDNNDNLGDIAEVLDVEKAIREYTEHYTSGTGKELTKKQLKVLKEMYSRCNILYGNESNLYTDITSDSTSLLEEIKKLEVERGREEARKMVSKYLLDIDEKTRLDAINYLMNDHEWLNQINEDLGFKGFQLDETREYMNEAMSAIECEQGFRNCQPNSEMMGQICLSIPNACGLDFYAFQRMMVSEYDLNIIEKYKIYFYTFES